MTKADGVSREHPIVIVSFDDAYAERFVHEVEKLCPAVHVSPLLRTLKASIEALQPSIIAFDLQTVKTEDHSIFEIIAMTNEVFPAARKIALGHQSAATQVISAMKAGACDFIERESSPHEIRQSLTWHLGQVRHHRAERPGHVVAVLSGRDNDGENEFTVNLAAYIATKHAKGEVLLLDLTLAETQLEIEFNVEVTYSVRDALEELLRLDQKVLMQVLAKHSSGLYLLPLTTRNSKDEEISPQQLAALLSGLRNCFKLIIINAGCLRDKYCQQYLLPLCDRLLMICPQMIGSISAARSLVPDRHTNPEQAAKFGLVISKYDPDVELKPAQLADRIGIPLVGKLPTAWVPLANSHNLGHPLVLSGFTNRYTRAIRIIGDHLLEGLGPRPIGPKDEARTGLFAWLDGLLKAGQPYEAR